MRRLGIFSLFLSLRLPLRLPLLLPLAACGGAEDE
jgi:hypothetical protein